MRAAYMLHDVGLANKLGLADDAHVLLDSEVSFNVNGAFILAFVNLTTELAGVGRLIVHSHLFHILIHVYLFAVHFEKLFGIARAIYRVVGTLQFVH